MTAECCARYTADGAGDGPAGPAEHDGGRGLAAMLAAFLSGCVRVLTAAVALILRELTRGRGPLLQPHRAPAASRRPGRWPQYVVPALGACQGPGRSAHGP